MQARNLRSSLLGGLLLALVLIPARADPLLRATLDSFSEARTLAIGTVPLLSGRLLSDFYAARQDQLAWRDVSAIQALYELAEASRKSGFDPKDFHAAQLRDWATPGRLDASSRVERLGADLVLSDALLRYVHHHRFGKLDPMAVDGKWHDREPVPSAVLLADMQAALDASDLAAALADRFPKPFWYERLARAFQGSVTRAHLAELPPLPPGGVLKVGSRGQRVAMLRERLQLIEGQTRPTPADPQMFEQALHEAVVAFQRRSGLTADGVVGPATLATLNGQGDAESTERIRINLERMRWLYDDLPPDYVLVDVAGYKVHLIRDHAIVWSTRAIVGTTETQTPMFRDTMDHLVFNPTWTVPASIQKKLGRVSGDYRIIDRRTGQRVSGGDVRDPQRYRLVQQPGPKNALGRVKFMFPNRHAIYLHDTPAKGLFARQTRALSNGCVRVQDPLELAERILDRPDWDQAGIARVVDRGRTRHVSLAEPLPVLLLYLTAYADEQGRVSYRRDVYERDQALREALASPVLRARIAFPEPPTPALPVVESPAEPLHPQKPASG